jgi:hypothetical protein
MSARYVEHVRAPAKPDEAGGDLAFRDADLCSRSSFQILSCCVKQFLLLSGDAADSRQPVVAYLVRPCLEGLVLGCPASLARANPRRLCQGVLPPALVDVCLLTAPRKALSGERQIDSPLRQLHTSSVGVGTIKFQPSRRAAGCVHAAPLSACRTSRVSPDVPRSRRRVLLPGAAQGARLALLPSPSVAPIRCDRHRVQGRQSRSHPTRPKGAPWTRGCDLDDESGAGCVPARNQCAPSFWSHIAIRLRGDGCQLKPAQRQADLPGAASATT